MQVVKFEKASFGDSAPNSGRRPSNYSRRGSDALSMSIGPNDAFFARPDTIETRFDRFVSGLTHRCIVEDPMAGHIRLVPWNGTVTLLFADISGYSKLANSLKHKGAHFLAHVVNSYFGCIVDVVLAHGGDVLKFAGDALIACWPHTDNGGEAELTAVRCACALQAKAGSFTVSESNATLGLHIGVSSGGLQATVFQSADESHRVMPRMFFFVTGPALVSVSAVCTAAPTGTVAVDGTVNASIADVAKTSAIAESAPQAFVVLSMDSAEVVRGSVAAPPSIDSSPGRRQAIEGDGTATEEGVSAKSHEQVAVFAASPWFTARRAEADESLVAPQIAERLRSGLRTSDMAEMRNIIVLFISQQATVPTEAWFSEVERLLAAQNCPLTQIIDDDKGVHIVAALNLFETVEGSHDAAVEIVAQLQEREAGCVVGVAAGTAFCGIVGSERLCRWDITGDVCVRACRLMEHAVRNGLPCAIDASVVDGLRDRSAVTACGEKTLLKGTEEPVSVFGLTNSDMPPVECICALGPDEFSTHVRGDTQKAIRAIADQADLQRGAVIVSGPPQSGKKYAMLGGLYGTAFVPIRFRLTTGSRLISKLAHWFAHHTIPSLKSIGERIVAASNAQKTTLALSLVIAALNELLVLGLNIALIIDQSQNVDATGQRLLQYVLAAPRESESTGRLLFLLSHTPRLGGATVSELQEFTNVQNASGPPIRPFILGPVPADMPSMWAHFAELPNERGPRPPAVFEKCNHLPGIFVQFMYYFAPRAAWPVLVKVTRGMLPPEDLAVYPNKDGMVNITPRMQVLADGHTMAEAIPTFLASCTAFYDPLTASQQLLLKLLASTSYERDGCPLDVLCRVAATFLDASPNSLRDEIKTLQHLQLVTVDDVENVHFAINAMREQVRSLVTPQQLAATCRRMAREMVKPGAMVPKDRVSRYRRHVALLQLEAGDKEAATAMLHAAWDACRETEIGELRVWSSHYLASAAADAAIAWDASLTDQPAFRSFTAPADYVRPDPAVFACRVVEPPLSLGPMCGFLMLLGRRTTWFSSDWPLSPSLQSLTAERYLLMVHLFEALVPIGEGPTFPLTLAEEETLIRDLIDAPRESAEFKAARSRFPQYANEAVYVRGRRVCAHLAAAVELPSMETVQQLATYIVQRNQWSDATTDSKSIEARRLANAAFAFVKDITPAMPEAEASTKVKQALVFLACSRWDTSFPYMTTIKLRDSWLKGWISSLQVKVILYLFAIMP
jgi:class 3 adenylate cyclase